MTMGDCVVCDKRKTLAVLIAVELEPNGSVVLVCAKCLKELKKGGMLK